MLETISIVLILLATTMTIVPRQMLTEESRITLYNHESPFVDWPGQVSSRQWIIRRSRRFPLLGPFTYRRGSPQRSGRSCRFQAQGSGGKIQSSNDSGVTSEASHCSQKTPYAHPTNHDFWFLFSWELQCHQSPFRNISNTNLTVPKAFWQMEKYDSDRLN